jgi:hypothetical protein
MLALTVICFLAMFFSWEASALIAPGLILAAVMERRGRLYTLFADPAVWLGMGVTGAVVVLQMSHAKLAQTQFLWYGTGFSDVKIDLMWRYPNYDPLYYVRESSWHTYALVPLVALAGAGLLTVRHAFRRPARFLFLTFLTPCLLMASFLSVIASRYCYHLMPLAILLSAAAIVAAARFLVRLPAPARLPGGWRLYAGGVGALAVVAAIVVGSGLTLQPMGIRSLRVSGALLGELRNTNFEGPVRFMRQHIRPGDVVIAVQPEVVNYLVARDGGLPFAPNWETDHWLETRLQLQAILDDRSALPAHRFSGTQMIATREALEEVFAQHERVWYITDPPFDQRTNVLPVESYLKENMDVVYEDFSSQLMLRDRNHRPAFLQSRDEKEAAAARGTVP